MIGWLNQRANPGSLERGQDLFNTLGYFFDDEGKTTKRDVLGDV